MVRVARRLGQQGLGDLRDELGPPRAGDLRRAVGVVRVHRMAALQLPRQRFLRRHHVRDRDPAHLALLAEHVDHAPVAELRHRQPGEVAQRRLVVEGGGEEGAHVGEEAAASLLGLGASAGTALLLVEAGVLDAEPDPVGHHLEQLRIVPAEVARLEGAHVKHADPPPLEENGNAEERADAALAEHGVRQLGAVDVLDDHRPLLRRHAPDEARADGDADVPRIRLFQPGGGALDEHVAVEQEDGGRVGGEDALHADEQLVEQLVERELRERGVGDRLESLDDLALSARGLVRLGQHRSQPTVRRRALDPLPTWQSSSSTSSARAGRARVAGARLSVDEGRARPATRVTLAPRRRRVKDGSEERWSVHSIARADDGLSRMFLLQAPLFR